MFSRHNFIGIALTVTLAVLVVLVGRSVFMPAAAPEAAATPVIGATGIGATGIESTNWAATSPPATFAPLPTPNIEATIQARVAEIVAAMPTVEPTPTLAAVEVADAVAPPTAPPPLPPTRVPLPLATAQPPATSAAAPTPAAPSTGYSNDLVAMVQRVKPGIVRIDTTAGGGSGIIFETTPDQGALILTNYHVIKAGSRINIRVNDETTYPGAVVGFDEARDLAVLEICCGDFIPLTFDTSETIMPGSEVIAIGYALQISGPATVTRGIVSAYRYHPRYFSWVLQTDAPINAGNSGGPLLLTSGEVVGINTFVYDRDAAGNRSEGINFALAERSIRGLLPELKNGARNPRVTPFIRWQTYANPDYDYTFRIPEDWEIDDSDRNYVRFASPDGAALASVMIPDWEITAADSYFDTRIARLEEHYDTFILTGRTRSTDSGETARIRYTGQLNGGCIEEYREQLTLVNGAAYWVGFSVCADSTEYYGQIGQTVLDSLQVMP